MPCPSPPADNGFAWFTPFIAAQPGSPLYDKGMARVDDLIAALDADMAAGTLPQVSWIVAPTNVSEHATNWPSAGEDFTARILKVVANHSDVYAKSAFILNYGAGRCAERRGAARHCVACRVLNCSYVCRRRVPCALRHVCLRADEGGQFFDHAWTPTPPMKQPADGISTVTTQGEVNFPGVLDVPIGLGFRVPLLVISPWSRGKGVVSEIFDHTSVIQFIEERFNVSNPNISPWRRAITGNLLSAFNFSTFDASWPVLPDTSQYVQNASIECSTLPAPEIPAVQSFPVQENGTRFSRALPYIFTVSDVATPAGVALQLSNEGAAGSPFMAYDILNMAAVTPRQYAVESGKFITDTLSLVANASGTAYAFALHGPNGFLRAFLGDVALDGGFGTRVSANVTYDVTAPGVGSVVINLANVDTTTTAVFTITDNVYGTGGPWTVSVAPGTTTSRSFDMSSVGHWYDFTVTAVPSTAAAATRHATRAQQVVKHAAASGRPPVVAAAATYPFERRAMGRMETGVDTISDPAMAVGKPGFAHDMAQRFGLLQPATGGALTTDALAAMPHPLLPERFRKFERREGDHKDAQWLWEPKEEL